MLLQRIRCLTGPGQGLLHELQHRHGACWYHHAACVMPPGLTLNPGPAHHGGHDAVQELHHSDLRPEAAPHRAHLQPNVPAVDA
jgi:hypothetical protein